MKEKGVRVYSFHEKVATSPRELLALRIHYNNETLSMLGRELAIRMHEVTRLQGEIEGIKADNVTLQTSLRNSSKPHI